MSIYRRNRTWWIKYNLNGRIIRHSLKTTDKQVAKYKECKILAEVTEGKLPPGFRKVRADVSLNEYLQASELSKGAKTIKTDHPRLKAFIAWAKTNELKQIDRKLIEDYLAYRIREDKIKPLTANHILSNIKAWLNWCLKRGYLTHNSAQGIKKYKIEQNPPRFLSRDEVQRLLEVAKGKNPLLYRMLAVAAYTGLRLSELLNLEWSNIDYKRGTITVENKTGFTTKSKRFRTIPINPKLRDILRENNKQGYCFSTKDGKPYKEPPRKEVQDILQDANLKGIGFHTLRHTFASQLVMQGVDLVTVKDLLGHSSVQTTMIYAHLSPKHLENAVQNLPY